MKKPFTFRLSEEIKKKLEKIAQENMVSITFLIHFAALELVAVYESKSKPSKQIKQAFKLKI